MQRACDACGTAYEAKLSTSRFCSTACRVRYHKGARPSAAVTAVVAVPAVAEGPITAATRSKLAAVNRLDHFAGVKALAAAAEMDRGGHLGSAWASLSKEHTALMVAALDGVAVAADPMDELKAWRDRRNAG